MPLVINDAGNVLYSAPDGSWQQAPMAVHPETGHAVAFDGQDWKPVTLPPSRAESLLRGAAAGLTGNFADELGGIMAASGYANAAPYLDKPTPNAQEYSDIYTSTRDKIRAVQQAAEAAHPGFYIGGQVAGGAALPGGAAMRGASLGSRMLGGAAVGAGYGALSGAGAGENTTDRASQALIGGGAGALIGGIAPPLVEGAIQGTRAAIAPVVTAVRGAINPTDEAARRVVTGIYRDVQNDPNAVQRLTPQEFQATPSATLLDLGGETTKALARSAANTSTEGRAALNATINDRYEGQTDRVTQWLNHTFNFPNARAQQDAIDRTEKAVNNASYKRAYAEGDKPLWSPELERLTGSPAVEAALRDAAKTGKDRAVNQGLGGFRSPITVTPDGRVTFNAGPNGVPTYPNLQFWDAARRNLSDAANAAQRAGRNDEASRLGSLSRSLNAELDKLVPNYQNARSGAAGFFNAENALEAGQNYVRQNFANGATRQALSEMSPTQRQLFQDGFVSRLVETLNQTGDRRNVLNKIADSPAAREKLNIALGPQKSKELESVLRVEGIMDMARTATQGNSTTVRQWVERGLAGGAGGLGAMGTYNMDPKEMAASAVLGALTAGGRHIDQRVARQVANMLVSNDPTNLVRGVQIIAKNGKFLDALRIADRRIAASGSQAVPKSLPSVQAPAIGRADENQPAVPGPPGQ